ncbi:MAG: FkbM family methyltransferase [Geodermatophilaceae bacterium]|nr:FkbM family methyltransferase [Geodermatophilaceae bacterium]
MRKVSAAPYYLSSVGTLLRSVRPVGASLRLLARRDEGAPVTVSVDGTKMQARGFMELWSIKETLLDDFYGRHGLAVQPGWTIIDIGCATGEFVVHALQRGAGVVVAVDPALASLDLLQTNLRLNGLSKSQVIVERAAVVATERAMHLPPKQAGLRSLHAAASEVDADSPDAVPGKTLSTLLASLPESRCDLVKLDCEGAEFEIILDTPDGVFDAIQRVVMEYHESSGRDVGEIAHSLRRRGYRVAVEESQVHRGLGYLYAARPDRRRA